ncbi:unnamed protein product [Cylicocyclus nassatus]|uniref:Uncharacterized protein n=1 Tax=Cylicocyclus nassatus TaxID=53992 RepID=A0AA36M5M7_CYLNA|nr:unnamed protein product [Cylicocyclus nassatus]
MQLFHLLSALLGPLMLLQATMGQQQQFNATGQEDDVVTQGIGSVLGKIGRWFLPSIFGGGVQGIMDYYGNKH